MAENNLDAIAKNLVQSLCDYFGIPFVNAGPVYKGMVAAGGSTLYRGAACFMVRKDR